MVILTLLRREVRHKEQMKETNRRLVDANKIRNGSEWKICPVCEGSGKMDAEVTIKWKPSKTEKK